MERLKKGQLVTLKAWYMPKRVYGHYEGKVRETWFGFRMLIVSGGWGLSQFHRSQLKPVRLTKKVKTK